MFLWLSYRQTKEAMVTQIHGFNPGIQFHLLVFLVFLGLDTGVFYKSGWIKNISKWVTKRERQTDGHMNWQQTGGQTEWACRETSIISLRHQDSPLSESQERLNMVSVLETKIYAACGKEACRMIYPKETFLLLYCKDKCCESHFNL